MTRNWHQEWPPAGVGGYMVRHIRALTYWSGARSFAPPHVVPPNLPPNTCRHRLCSPVAEQRAASPVISPVSRAREAAPGVSAKRLGPPFVAFNPECA